MGGGGGIGNGGTAAAAGGNLAVAVGVGGNGGTGGNGNTVAIQNSGTIITRGAASTGVVAQSVGGGGGDAGKGASTAGGVTPLSKTQALFDLLAGGFNASQKVTDIGDGILQVGQIGEDIKATRDELESFLPQPQPPPPDPNNPKKEEGTAVQINVAVSVGGKGGAGGNGGVVTASNDGAVITFGAQSHGIFAQSVGGGGGSGGASTATGSASDDAQVQNAVGVGGSGGSAGSGGNVTVTNSAAGSILTQGVASFGMFAQSVGGGGGTGALAGVVSGSLKSLSVAVGGKGGSAGNGGTQVLVENDGTITTTGKHGIGIVAESIGGGGGEVTTMTTDETFDPSKIVNNPQGRVADVHGVGLVFGGQGGSSGSGGAVVVQTSGSITTSGLDAHGIVAQSIGARGGLLVGGQVLAYPSLPAGGGNGDGGAVSLNLNPGTAISTGANGAYGVIAQSIGGGGGFAGDPSSAFVRQVGTSGVVVPNNGNGGAVTIAARNATIKTAGDPAPAIFAQSVGGGGGVIDSNNVSARGTAGGSGAGGGVTINLVSSVVATTGWDSPAILAQSAGTSSGAIAINIDANSQVSGGNHSLTPTQPVSQGDSAAIRLLGGTGNTIVNAGTITGINSGPPGGSFVAIVSDAPVAITNSGSISGDIFIGGTMTGGAGAVANLRGGRIDAPSAINLGGGTITNTGTLSVGGARSIGTTTLTGNLVQTPGGVINIGIDPLNKRADLLGVTGTATLAGTIVVAPTSLVKGTSTVLTAGGGIAAGSTVIGNATTLFSFDPAVQGNVVTVTSNAHLVEAADASPSHRSLATYLQHLWDSGDTSFAPGFLQLAGISGATDYARALNNSSGRICSASLRRATRRARSSRARRSVVRCSSTIPRCSGRILASGSAPRSWTTTAERTVRSLAITGRARR